MDRDGARQVEVIRRVLGLTGWRLRLVWWAVLFAGLA